MLAEVFDLGQVVLLLENLAKLIKQIVGVVFGVLGAGSKPAPKKPQT